MPGRWSPTIVGAPRLKRYQVFGNLFAAVDGVENLVVSVAVAIGDAGGIDAGLGGEAGPDQGHIFARRRFVERDTQVQVGRADPAGAHAHPHRIGRVARRDGIDV